MNEHSKGLIAKHPIFSILTTDEFDQLARLFTVKKFAAGETIVKKDELVDAIYFITEGKAEVGENSPIATLGRGESIGLSDTGFYSTTGARSTTVTAVSDVITLRLEIEQFHDFLTKHPQINQTIEDNASTFLRMRFIKQAAPFKNLLPESLILFAEKISDVTTPIGTVLFKQGDMGDSCYLIVSGKIDISIQDSDGKSKTVAQLGTSQLIGETALLLDIPRNGTATAIEDTKLLQISKPLFLEIMEKESDAAKAIIVLHQKRIRPIQAENIEISRQKTDDGTENVVLKNMETHDYYQLSSHAFFVWKLLDGTRNMNTILREFLKEFHFLDSRSIYELISDLSDLGFIKLDIKEQKSIAEKLPFWIRFFSRLRKIMEATYAFKNTDNWVTKSYNHFFWIFYTKIAKIILAFVAISGFTIFVFHFNQIVPAFNASSMRWPLFLMASYALLITAVPHELAHAYTTKSCGRNVHAFGVGILWGSLFAFCDSSDMWSCPDKKSRIAVDLAGCYVNIIISSLAAWGILLSSHSHISIFLWLFAFFGYMSVIGNLNPTLELDGYYVLMDKLGKSNLRESSIEALIKAMATKKSKLSFFVTFKQYPKELIYWKTCIVYLAITAIIPYFLIHDVFYGLFGTQNPLLGIFFTLLTVALSGLGIWSQIQEKKHLSSQKPQNK